MLILKFLLRRDYNLKKIFTIIFIFLFSFLPSFSCSTPKKSYLPEPLGNLQIEYEKTEKKLMKVYNKIMFKIGKASFENFQVPPAIIQESLKKSQQIWMKYLKENCKAYYLLHSGGTSRNREEMICLIEMTKERIDFLKETYLKYTSWK